MSRFGFTALTVLAMFAVLALPTASAEDVTLIFQPQHSNVSGYGDETVVNIMIDIPAGMQVSYGQLGFDYDSSCGEIIDRQLNTDIMTGIDLSWSIWNSPSLEDDCWDRDTEWIVYSFWIPKDGPTQALIGNFTIRGNSANHCVSELNFNCMPGCKQGCTLVQDLADQPVSFTVSNGTFTCGTASSAETFSKSLYEGWNLISLPLVPGDNSVDAVLSEVLYDADAVYRYDATSKQFESADMMDPGTGYFVYVTADCTWTYDGTPYTSMDVSLKQGLNMVGWLNSTKDVGALSSISDCYYVAQWGATAETFGVYNPAAPASFNDFTTMERGTGYFISVKQDCTLSESC